MPLGFWFVTGETRRAFAILYLLLQESWIVGSFQPTLCTSVCLPLPGLRPLPRAPFPLAPDLHLDTPRPSGGEGGSEGFWLPKGPASGPGKVLGKSIRCRKSVGQWSGNNCTTKDSPIPSVLLPGTWFGGNRGL